ncbi:MAG: hypothetical protein R3F05_13470 [Planctomycetota bacterium]|nr:hypothetical protein [Planctomycetota bacterium]MCB9824421.1 hypothetical protein [Planctomycetota bacterium]MCB9900418.1 hypothetical protein [Planctomycetota bacterium]
MFLRDGLPLYDLPETSRRLLRGPAWLRRQARSQAVPAAWVDGSLGFAAPWVDAACGERPDDPEAVATYWCARLAPPPPGAHRALADRAELPLADDELLDAEDAARRLYASAAALTRLEADGTLPALRVDGERRFDRVLVELVAEQLAAESTTPADLEGRAAERRAFLAPHARFAHRTGLAPAPSETTPVVPPGDETPSDAVPPDAVDVGAWQPPTDLGLDDIEPLPPVRPRIVEADGFDVVEDD